MHPCSPHAPADVFTSSPPLWTARSRRRTDVGARRHDTPLPGTLSPFPSFCFARTLRARKQHVFELPPFSSTPISGGCVGLWYTLAPELFAALSRTFRRHPGGSSGRTRDPASASGAQPLPLAALPTTPRRAPALARLSPAQISPAPSHSVFPAHPARPRSPALATSVSAPPSPRRLLSANKNLAHICASSLLHARVLVLCACECKFECECDCAWKNVRPTVP